MSKVVIPLGDLRVLIPRGRAKVLGQEASGNARHYGEHNEKQSVKFGHKQSSHIRVKIHLVTKLHTRYESSIKLVSYYLAITL